MTLEAWGFNHSIVTAAESGHYTREQLNFLKMQKAHVTNTIALILDRQQPKNATDEGPSTPPLRRQPKLSDVDGKQKKRDQAQPYVGNGVEKEEYLANDPPHPSSRALRAIPEACEPYQGSAREDRGKGRTRPCSSNKSTQPCNFKCCHTCRQLSRDRSFMSFEEALSDKAPPDAFWQPEKMPIANTRVVRNLGLRNYPMEFSNSSASGLSISRERTGSSVSNEGYPLARQASLPEVAYRSSMSDDAETAIKMADGSSPKEPRHFHTPRSTEGNAPQPIRRRSQEETAEETSERLSVDEKIDVLNTLFKQSGGRNLKLWKVMSDYLLKRAASTELPGGDDSVPTNEHTHPGEEHGAKAVAVKEEAVETKSADIIVSV